MCDSTVAGPAARRDKVLASNCEYPPFRYPPFKCARNREEQSDAGVDQNFQRDLAAIGPYEF